MSKLLHKQILEFIPPNYHVDGLIEICRVIDGILENYFNDLNVADQQRNPKTVTYSIEDWARMVGCDVTDMSLDNARKEVIMTLKGQTQINKSAVKKLVESNTNAECEIKEIFDKYYIYITFTSTIGIPPNIPQIRKKLREVLPAHLEFELIFRYRTWAEWRALGKPYSYYKEKGYTWKDIRERGNL